MDDGGDWARLLAQASGQPARAPELICELCVHTLGIGGAGISLVTKAGNRGVVCATDDISAQIEGLQYTLGEGPCVDAVTSGWPVLIPDLVHPGDLAVERWPGFMRAAIEAGVRALFAFPMRIGAINVGVLDVYRAEAGDLDSQQLTRALMASDAAALALLHQASGRDDLFADNIETRSSYQLQVHQATGMVQVQLNVSTQEAFLMLRARAFATGRALVDIASDVVDRRLRFSPEDL